MKKIILNKYFLTVIGIIFFFLLWYLTYLVAGSSTAIFPSPYETLIEAFSYLGDAYIYKCVWGSFYRMLIGFGVASLLGIFFGMIVGNFTSIKYVFNPTIIALKSIPTAAIVFLFLMLAGLRNAPIYVVGVIVFPIVYESTVSGYNHIDRYVNMAMRVDSASFLRNNFVVKLPLSFPYIAVGLISSFALSFKIEIMAEVISGSSSYGLGRAIQSSYINSTNGLVPTFAYAFIAIVVMLLVSLIVDIIKKAFKLKDLVA